MSQKHFNLKWDPGTDTAILDGKCFHSGEELWQFLLDTSLTMQVRERTSDYQMPQEVREFLSRRIPTKPANKITLEDLDL